MGQLLGLQEELRKLLFISKKQPTESRFWKEGLPKRLQVYRNTVHGNCYDTIDSDYSLTMKQFSEDEWFDISHAYFAKYPPPTFELNHCVTTFPKFLKTWKTKPHVPELADYELIDLQTFIHTAVPVKKLGVTNPTVATRIFQFQIQDWVEKGAPPEKTPKQKAEVLVFYRDLDHNVRVLKGEPIMLLMIDHFAKPGADMHEFEHICKKLLPQNTASLKKVFSELTEADLILA